MTVFKGAARAGVDDAHHGIYIHFIRDDPGFTFKIEELCTSTHAVACMLADTGIKIDINFFTGIGALPRFQEFVIHDIASVIIIDSAVRIALRLIEKQNEKGCLRQFRQKSGVLKREWKKMRFFSFKAVIVHADRALSG